MIDFDELKLKGWTSVSGISSPERMIQLGKTLGTPVPSPNGELVKEIRITPAAEASPGSQSAIYNKGPFPLHTDTVFWPTPVRYVILRGYGDTRRPTTAMSFARLLQNHDKFFVKLSERSVWVAGPESKRFYCSLIFRHGDSIGWRYDADLMKPVNAAAKEVDRILRPMVKREDTDSVDWSENTAVIFSNWNALHGRGKEPENEGSRVIERLYVR